MAENKPNTLIGLDGMTRQPQDEENLNTLCHQLFTSSGGSEVLRYLKSMTIEAVAGAGISDTELRHLEGQRYIVGLIQRRVNKGASQKIVKEKSNG